MSPDPSKLRLGLLILLVIGSVAWSAGAADATDVQFPFRCKETKKLEPASEGKTEFRLHPDGTVDRADVSETSRNSVELVPRDGNQGGEKAKVVVTWVEGDKESLIACDENASSRFFLKSHDSPSLGLNGFFRVSWFASERSAPLGPATSVAIEGVRKRLGKDKAEDVAKAEARERSHVRRKVIDSLLDRIRDQKEFVAALDRVEAQSKACKFAWPGACDALREVAADLKRLDVRHLERTRRGPVLMQLRNQAEAVSEKELIAHCAAQVTGSVVSSQDVLDAYEIARWELPATRFSATLPMAWSAGERSPVEIRPEPISAWVIRVPSPHPRPAVDFGQVKDAKNGGGDALATVLGFVFSAAAKGGLVGLTEGKGAAFPFDESEPFELEDLTTLADCRDKAKDVPRPPLAPLADYTSFVKPLGVAEKDMHYRAMLCEASPCAPEGESANRALTTIEVNRPTRISLGVDATIDGIPSADSYGNWNWVAVGDLTGPDQVFQLSRGVSPFNALSSSLLLAWFPGQEQRHGVSFGTSIFVRPLRQWTAGYVYDLQHGFWFTARMGTRWSSEPYDPNEGKRVAVPRAGDGTVPSSPPVPRHDVFKPVLSIGIVLDLAKLGDAASALLKKAGVTQ